MSVPTFTIRRVEKIAPNSIVTCWRILVSEPGRHSRPLGPLFLDYLNARQFAKNHGLVGQLESAVLAGAM